MNKYDAIIVGAGIYGSVLAQQLTEQKKKVLVIDKRHHIGGNCYTEMQYGIPVHMYGGHVWNNDSDKVQDYISQFTKFNNFKCSVKVNYLNKIYSFPINLFTLHQLYGCTTPHEARTALEARKVSIDSPKNLEEWCLSQVGPEIYEIFIKGYTERQWGRSAKDLPISIIKRIPIRFDMSDHYFTTTKYEGIPIGGYTPMFERMLSGVEVQLNTDFLSEKSVFERLSDNIIYTGPIDELLDYKLGPLPYRSLRFDFRTVDGVFQGNHTVNYTHSSVPFNRIHEHCFFDLQSNPYKSVISYEFPEEWVVGKERYYPIGSDENRDLYRQYRELLPKNYLVGGRLGSYLYMDMHMVVAQALKDGENFGK
jgi:UDP-galactopyranose mutase